MNIFFSELFFDVDFVSVEAVEQAPDGVYSGGAVSDSYRGNAAELLDALLAVIVDVVVDDMVIYFICLDSS